MERSEIEKIVRDVLSTALQATLAEGAEVFRENEPLWDSLKHIEIIFMLEGRLGVRFSEMQMAELDSIDNIVAAVLAINEA